MTEILISVSVAFAAREVHPSPSPTKSIVVVAAEIKALAAYCCPGPLRRRPVNFTSKRGTFLRNSWCRFSVTTFESHFHMPATLYIDGWEVSSSFIAQF
jgi:hypothetical protein